MFIIMSNVISRFLGAWGWFLNKFLVKWILGNVLQIGVMSELKYRAHPPTVVV